MATIKARGQTYHIRKPAQAVAYGVKQQGKKGQLVLALRKKGEVPEEAINRVSARHPGTQFVPFDEVEMFDATEFFGVEDDAQAELSFDVVFDDLDVMRLASKHARAAAALGSAQMDDEEALQKLISDALQEEGD